MNLEEFAEKYGRNIAVSDFNRRRVERVVSGTGGEGPVWTIEFYGGGKIHNYDPLLSVPKIENAELTLVILGGKQVLGKHVTELRFGMEPVYLNPLEYSMQDDTITNGEEVFAQRSHANK